MKVMITERLLGMRNQNERNKEIKNNGLTCVNCGKWKEHGKTDDADIS